MLLHRRVTLNMAPHTAEQIPFLLRKVFLTKLCGSDESFPLDRHISKHKPQKKNSTNQTLEMWKYRHLCHTACLCWPNNVVSSRTSLPPILFIHAISLNPRNHPYSLCSRRIISPCLTNSTGIEGSDRSAEGRQPYHINALTNISGS